MSSTRVTGQVTVTSSVGNLVSNLTNQVMEAFYTIAEGRGLSVGHMTDNRKDIEGGILTWLTTRHLIAIHFEVIGEDPQFALERWDVMVKYDYTLGPNALGDVDPVDQQAISSQCRKMRSLPPGVRYRLIVSLKEGAPAVPGWSRTDLGELRNPKELRIAAFGGYYQGEGLGGELYCMEGEM